MDPGPHRIEGDPEFIGNLLIGEFVGFPESVGFPQFHGEGVDGFRPRFANF